MTKLIVVAVDGSEHSRKALELACELAEKLNERLHLLHVAQALHQDKTLVVGAAAVTIHASPEELKQAGQKVIEAAKAIARDHGCGEVDGEVAVGDPAKVILQVASDNKAHMIVMGSRGHSDLTGLMLGSVSHKVCHLAKCTCVTVR
jgi:nucleotide-binding universal stress UspA family protein